MDRITYSIVCEQAAGCPLIRAAERELGLVCLVHKQQVTGRGRTPLNAANVEVMVRRKQMRTEFEPRFGRLKCRERNSATLIPVTMSEKPADAPAET